MNRSFILGVLVGVAGAVVPDVVEIARTWKEQPEYRVHIYWTLGVFALIIGILIITEIRGDE